MQWSAAQYVKFAGERTRAARDLLAAVPLTDPARVVDIGCGPGNSTELLIDRYPGAEISGIDNDPDMLKTARATLPGHAFVQADIADWQPDRPVDLLFANASLQWIDDHRALFTRLVAHLAPGGALAVQMPDNLSEPTHQAMRHIAALPLWSARLSAAAEQRKPLLPPAELHALLRPLCSKVDVWRTTYHFEMTGLEGIGEWFQGSALRPYLQLLTPDEQADFMAAWYEEIAAAYPVADGRCLLAFPRYFFVCVA